MTLGTTVRTGSSEPESARVVVESLRNAPTHASARS
ncbi:hypothetical protein FHX44_116281 [Pseudonocardia hierapolitana]|uniref:Uncharacterized protein n=1 Tax=Pseudonocardia hierapolitana TaxID=1128676 RepID=A0A561SZP4_9PSEU|nr:hypothetical protein FHX44_116281 [Pseudonocardia hierapolitana]